MRYVIISWLLVLLTACTGKPEDIEPIGQFELERYLGTWYELARLDHSFEEGLQQVSAEYSLRDDGGVKVLNQGFDGQQWQQAEGKAYFVEETTTGYLKVSFFGPFYGSYIIFELDDDYQYAFVSGPNHDYLWLLSRSPKLSPDLLKHFKHSANKAGFKLDELIVVEH